MVKVIVPVKSSGCLQIGCRGPIIDYMYFLFDPLTPVNKILKGIKRSLVCPHKLQILADFITNFNVFHCE